jgi:hypothetical protein
LFNIYSVLIIINIYKIKLELGKKLR